MSLCIRRFRCDESGAAAVDLALWMPVFWLLFGVIVDATMLFKYQTQFVDVAREASRQVSIDRMTQQEAYDYLVSRFPNIDNIQADVFVDATTVTATVHAPMKSLTMFSSIFTGNADVHGQISMFMEQAIAPEVVPTEGV